ncbi:hypothetical protein GDO81_028565 [Engystomops pustulosus]|uniref:Uncharacterized protein n=1 Tax=Engystomops pustulosus TaxID=76066 RepID=A0AAV6YN39_ENGPU|nr:hypothetical protein GDO81_028565 [Engystomops pustulosus]
MQNLNHRITRDPRTRDSEQTSYPKPEIKDQKHPNHLSLILEEDIMIKRLRREVTEPADASSDAVHTRTTRSRSFILQRRTFLGDNSQDQFTLSRLRVFGGGSCAQ